MKEIKFYEKSHKYKLGRQELTSVTTWLGQFFSKFEAKEIARKLAKFPANKAKKHGVRYFLKTWKEDADHGTRVHNALEQYLETGNQYVGVKNERDTAKVTQGMKAFEDLTHNQFDKPYKYLPEQIVFDEELGIAGTIDVMGVNGNNIMLADWKTNKKISTKSYDGKLCSRPISHLEDCNYNKYMLQLNLYAYILERQGFTIDGLKLVHLTEDKYKIYDIEHNPQLIKELIEWTEKQTKKE